MTAVKTVVIVGSDTGVGKTFVGCGVARALVDIGRRVVAIKPVETGCADEPAPTEDGVQLARASGQRSPRMALRRFRHAITPALAADLEGGAVELAPLRADLARESAAADILLLEGAGGLLSPLAWTWSLIDLALALQATALVVAGDRLGCLNHALLTVQALGQAGIPIAGVVLSAPPVPDASTGGNFTVLRRLLPGRPIAALPRLPLPDGDARFPEIARWLCP